MGESDRLQQRLKSHQRDKDFWTHAVAFTSKDQNLNKAHVQYLESRLVQLADEAKRCELDNGNVPNPPSLSEPDKADAELYLADMLLCLPVLGVSFFEKPSEPDSNDESRFPQKRQSTALFLRAKDIEAEGFEDAGGFVVRSGSRAVKNETPAIHSYLSDLREKLLGQGLLEDSGNAYTVTQDWVFRSPSMAASVLLGQNRNGRIEWKNADGRTLKEIQQAQVDD